jgi:hypothetical protein
MVCAGYRSDDKFHAYGLEEYTFPGDRPTGTVVPTTFFTTSKALGGYRIQDLGGRG